MANIVNMSDAASIGIHAMGVLAACPNEKLSNKRIADMLGVSDNHLAKVMQRLVRTGLALGTRGPNGGFSLSMPAEQISLLQIFEALEGKLARRECLLDHPRCSGEACVMGGLLNKIHKETMHYFSHTTLADLKPIFTPAKNTDK